MPLSGYAGQVSLCQFTFLGIGAVTMHAVDGGSSVLGLLAAVGVCAGVGAVLALPVLRLRGLYLALATLAFAVLMDNVFFQSSSIMGVGGTVAVGRPDIFGMRFTTDRAFDVFLAVVLALCLIGVGALRRGPFGRRLVGMSDSPAACSTVGLSLTMTKLTVFAFSAGLAGSGRRPLRRARHRGRRSAVRLPLQHRHLRRLDTSRESTSSPAPSSPGCSSPSAR